MKSKIKIYHILTHSIEEFIPDLRDSKSNFSFINHTVNKFIKALIKYDVKKEFEHILCIPSKKHSKISEYHHKDGYLIKVFPSVGIGFLFQYSFLLIKYIKSLKDGIIHVYGTGSFLYDFIAPFLRKKKTIVHYMGGHFTWKNFFFGFIKYGLLQRYTLTIPEKLFIQNQYRIEKYHKNYGIPYSKMLFVPVALEESDYSIPKRQIFKKEVVILFVGRLEKAKGILELIEVFEILNKENKHITLKIVGDGSLVSFIKQKESENIKYLGQLNYFELNKVYIESDIFVLPTHFDCFPSVLLEAGISGLPSVSTTVEGPLSIIEDGYNGFLVNVMDKKHLFLKIEMLIKDHKLRKKLGTQARKNVLEKFTWNSIVNIYYDTYTRLYQKK